VVNAVTITGAAGHDAVYLGGLYDNRLIVDPGASSTAMSKQAPMASTYWNWHRAPRPPAPSLGWAGNIPDSAT